jgi:aminoglycoside 6'-N-acetyltransferase I
MRSALWPHDGPGPGDHPEEIRRYFRGEMHEPLEVLVAEEEDEGRSDGEPPRLVGLAELNLRNYAEGCRTDRVGYLEGWWVDPEHRRRGVGRALVRAALDWAREQGCTEFASDTTPDNGVSQRAHEALGFEEVERTVCYRRPLETNAR